MENEIAGFGLENIARLRKGQSRSLSAENPTGEKGGGARMKPGEPGSFFAAGGDLGQGWKVCPCIHVSPGETATLADVAGPGVFRHFWFAAVASDAPDGRCGHAIDMERLTLRMQWDDEAEPSVAVPLGDFFVSFFNCSYDLCSAPVTIAPQGALNCYWPMPFAERAVISLENRSDRLLRLYYQLDYELTDLPADAGRFHAQFRESVPRKERPEHVVLDGVRGHGHYVGTAIGWEQRTACGWDNWWGEGEAKFFIDGDGEFPTICTTGTEDYFCGAQGFGGCRVFSFPLNGLPYSEPSGQPPARHVLYRWHLADRVIFHRDLRVTQQTMGVKDVYLPLPDRLRSVAYWYQA